MWPRRHFSSAVRITGVSRLVFEFECKFRSPRTYIRGCPNFSCTLFGSVPPSIIHDCCGRVTDFRAACLYENANFESTLCRVAFHQEDWETKMKKIAFATAAVTMLLTGAASAADLAARPYTKAPAMIAPIYNWGGFYVGVNGGYGTSHKCWDNVGFVGLPLAAVSEGCHDADRGTVGGQVGYRWQASNWVFGLEAQGNWADFSGRNNSLAFPGLYNRTRIDAFGFFTGQVGYSWNNA